MLSCHSVTSKLKIDQRTHLNEVTYSDVFGTTFDQLNMTLLLQSRLKIQDRLLETGQERTCLRNNSGPYTNTNVLFCYGNTYISGTTS